MALGVLQGMLRYLTTARIFCSYTTHTFGTWRHSGTYHMIPFYSGHHGCIILQKMKQTAQSSTGCLRRAHDYLSSDVHVRACCRARHYPIAASHNTGSSYPNLACGNERVGVGQRASPCRSTSLAELSEAEANVSFAAFRRSLSSSHVLSRLAPHFYRSNSA